MGAYSELAIENDSFSTEEDLSGFSMEGESESFGPPPSQHEEPSAAQAAIPASAPASDGSAGNGDASGGDEVKTDADSEDAKRKAHEEAETKRKAEFDAKQAAKKAAQKEQLAKVAAMSDDEVMAASMMRVSADTEKLTRRNMKECVAEYIQTKCIEDPAFARLAMHPLKSMIHCFWYINRKAREYLQEEMKMNDEQPPQGVNGVYGGDVPDDLCYSWAEEYFRDPDAEEDHRDEAKFVPKPYIGATSKGKTASKTKSTDKKQAEKKSPEKPQDKPKPKEDDGQMSLLGVA